jgi:hypothetical protein
MQRPETGRDPQVLNRPTLGAVLLWALVGVLLTLVVSLGWWGVTMREQQRDLVARVRRLQDATPDRTPPFVIRVSAGTPEIAFAFPSARWIVLVFEGAGEGDLRLELRSGGVSVWTAVEPARGGLAVPPALPASLLPPGAYELRVNDRVHRLTVTAAAPP